MDASLETAGRIEAGTSTAPVIIPLQEAIDEGRGARDEERGTDGLPRFAFPELPATGEGPLKATWPACTHPEMAGACAELAENIRWRLPPRHSTILAFTSPGDGDGKTSLMLSLAPQLAKRVAGGLLVVDASFRKPDLTMRVVITAERTHYRPARIHATNLSGLSFLPAPAMATAQLSHQRDLMLWRRQAAWLSHLRDRWPLVLVDLPSLEHVEPAAMMSSCDGVYLVVRLGHTARRAIAEAVRVIERSGGRLLGCAAVE